MSTFISLLAESYPALVEAYRHRMTPDMHQAITAMCHCQTGQVGYSQWHCAHCQHDDALPLSCGHRSCPQCQHRTTMEWLSRQQQKQLPVDYFMVTLTLPAQFRSLALRYPKALYQRMFAVASALMKDFATRKQGGKSGFTMVLHTHSRRRELHPHLHVIVPAGYYDAARKQWNKGEKGYLYNAFALARVWRARMLEAIYQHPLLTLPPLLPGKWVVDCRYIGRGASVLKYLSRYLYRGVLPDRDIINIDNGEVTFRYREGKTQQWRTRTLPTLEFLWLILQHVLPKGFQRVRDYGLLHCSAKLLRLQLLLLLMQMGWRPESIDAPPPKALRSCPCCKGLMLCTGVTRPG